MEKKFLLKICVVFFSLSLSADIKDHLKPAETKSEMHNIPNVDFIYMINLDQRPEK
jgi:hypothetical protein